MASRMVARSTTAGTPVKSCMSTRAGRNAISRSAAPLGGPIRQGGDVLGVDAYAVFAAQQVLQQHLEREGQLPEGARNPRRPGPRGCSNR